MICSQISQNIFKGGIMKTVTLSVRSHDDAIADVKKALRSGVAQKTARINFATPEMLWKILTAKRWELLKALCGAGPVTFRRAAELVDRDVKAVHADLTALMKAGVLKREAEGVVFPYEAIKVEYELKATG
jgi:predicted transcriptional regulator